MLVASRRLIQTKSPRYIPLRKWMSSSPYVFDVDEKSFAAKVMQAKVPVILDCHAEWCGPCKQLGPVLEAEVKKLNGKVVMAKLDTDKNPQLAQSLQIRSLPTVLAVFQGKLTDQFVGAQPKEAVAAFVQKAAGAGSANLAADAENIFNQVVDAVVKSDYKPDDNIKAVLSQIVDLDISKESKEDTEKLMKIKARTLALLVQVAIKLDDLEDAKTVCDLITKEYKAHINEPDVKSAIAALKFAESADPEAASKVNNLSTKTDLTSQDRLDLARALFSQGEHSEAVEHALKLMKTDRKFQDEAAKRLLLEIFDVLGPSSDITKYGRRKMTSLLLI